MNTLSPVIRLSWGLVILTCSLLIVLDLAGLMPTPADIRLESRIRLCEQLAAQAAIAAERSDFASVRAALQVAVRRNEEVLSAALRAADGRLLVVAGDHAALWESETETGSTSTHARIPLFRSGGPWATLEVRFQQPGPGSLIEALWSRPMVRLLVLMAAAGFLSYGLYLRRSLRHLDPSSVIPSRVQTTLDVMAEGVLLLDDRGRVVLANETFAERSGQPRAALMGRKASSLDWRVPRSDEAPRSYPWLEAIRQSQTHAGRLHLRTADGELRSFVIKGAPVLDGFGRAKGAIATFDDVTELERKHAELEEANGRLEKSQEEIRLQNEELTILARSDPLTGVANRRAFLERFETYFTSAKQEGRRLCAVMVDIDHFKRVNDDHGHLMGDEVIRGVSEALSQEVRSTDAVCRYGGEEFCIVLPDATVEVAVNVAERIRRKIASPGFARVPVTASFGVSSMSFGASKALELINQADEALYASKEAGRNRVTRWDALGRHSPGASPAPGRVQGPTRRHR